MPGDELLAALAPVREFLPAVSDRQAAALQAYIELLLRWNKTINLTAVRDFPGAVRKHVAEGLFLASRIPESAVSVCDVGSGCGVPGIPVAILRPRAAVTLIESDVRKGVFLREAARELGNVRVVTARFEDVAGDFDWLVSRAVNLSAIRRGPECERAAFLGGESIGDAAGLVVRFSWTRSPAPWEGGGFLWVGDVSRETFAS